ncbi:cytochrome-c oxidase, cbb3-type subunit III [Alphaproteobacteria bacterium KMM 3653]|uniref:Cbb3-type cytochrome c oxidase subunit n=1 Tax=Harenicola maris TaxID=2841044 RepID=A0AAP2CP17_9RHOB|nr:cytochrome-c oxidase, cbb3-type subunit III [Harenicola maris]
MSQPDTDAVTGTDTTGHEWDGIKELNNPLPRWWLWCLYLTIIWGVGYSIAYPAWPMISGATKGVLGYSTRAEVAAEITRFNDQNAALKTALAEVDLTTLAQNPDLQRFAVANGAAVFRTNCSQCHGSGAAGSKGYPNLQDDDWLWGGEIDQIAHTVRHGIRNETDLDAHYSQMPAFGELLEEGEIKDTAQYVLSLSGQDHDAEAAARGTVIFEEQCSACHGDAGLGDIEQGAPNLADAIWLYGGDIAAIEETITNARFGVMPAWGERLSQSDVNAVAAYVHGLGGGE